jgi:hypothetical protein
MANGRNVYQMDIKYTHNFHYKTFKKTYPDLDLWFKIYHVATLVLT